MTDDLAARVAAWLNTPEYEPNETIGIIGDLFARVQELETMDRREKDSPAQHSQGSPPVDTSDDATRLGSDKSGPGVAPRLSTFQSQRAGAADGNSTLSVGTPSGSGAASDNNSRGESDVNTRNSGVRPDRIEPNGAALAVTVVTAGRDRQDQRAGAAPASLGVSEVVAATGPTLERKYSPFACSVCGKNSAEGWAIYRTSPKGSPFVGVCDEHRTFAVKGAPDVAAMIEEAQHGPRTGPTLVEPRRFACFTWKDGVYEHAQGEHVSYADWREAADRIEALEHLQHMTHMDFEHACDLHVEEMQKNDRLRAELAEAARYLELLREVAACGVEYDAGKYLTIQMGRTTLREIRDLIYGQIDAAMRGEGK